MKRFLPFIAVLVAMLIWAGSGIAVQQALHVFRPLTLIIIRFTISVLLMLPLGLAFRRMAKRTGNKHLSMLALQPLEKRDIPLFLLAGFVEPVLYYISETYCYRALSSPTIAEALLSTGPLIAPIFAFLFLRERVTRNNIIGIVISTVGMLMLVLVGAQNFDLGNPIGILLAMLSVLCAVMYTILIRKIPEHYSLLSIVFYGDLTALLFFYPIWGLVEAQTCMTEGWQLIPDATLAWQAIAYLAVFSSVVAFVLYCYSVRPIGVTLANAFNNARPIFTALIMLLVFNEQLPLGKWVGIALVVIGLFVCQKREKPRLKNE